MTAKLQNKLFISTRPKGQSDDLKHLLAAEGAALLEMPMIEIRYRKPDENEKRLFKNTDQFNWLIFTSPNGVKSFFSILKELEIKTLPVGIQVAVVGKKTEKVLQTFGYKAAFVNPGNTGEELAAALLQKLKDEKEKPKVLLVLGNLARNVIQDKLSPVADCTRVDVYETVAPEITNNEALEIIRNNNYEMLIATSPSTIQNFMKLNTNIPAANIRFACIGEITAREAIKQGFPPLVVAKDASAEGIVQSIIQSYSKNVQKL